MQLYQKVQGQGAAAPPGTQKLAERDVVAVSLLLSDILASARPYVVQTLRNKTATLTGHSTTHIRQAYVHV